MGEKSIKVHQSFIRAYFMAIFGSSNIETIRKSLESVKKTLNYDGAFYIPYDIAVEYLESERDPAIIERQHPEMRDAC